jgi:hypothetical protein
MIVRLVSCFSQVSAKLRKEMIHSNGCSRRTHWDQLSKTRAPAHIRAGALVFGYFTTPILIREEINPLIGVPDPAELEQFWLYLLRKEDRVPDLWKHYRIALEACLQLRPRALQLGPSKAVHQ